MEHNVAKATDHNKVMVHSQATTHSQATVHNQVTVLNQVMEPSQLLRQVEVSRIKLRDVATPKQSAGTPREGAEVRKDVEDKFGWILDFDTAGQQVNHRLRFGWYCVSCIVS